MQGPLGAMTRTVSLLRVRWSQRRGSELWQVPLGPSSFVWGIREAVRRLLGWSRREMKADRGQYGWRTSSWSLPWQVGPKAFPEGGRGRETEGLWEDFRI